jgi:hypothetical protein
MKQKHLQQLFDKPMDRREFLAHIGAAILMVMGISGILKRLLDLNAHPRQQVQVGYGSSPYGGASKH